MANKKRGEVSVEAFGNTYTMRLGTNQICALEDDLNLGINEIAEKLSDPAKMRLGFLRTIVFHAVNWGDDNPEKSLAGELIDELGAEKTGEKIGEAFNAAFPDAKDSQDPPAKAG